MSANRPESVPAETLVYTQVRVREEESGALALCVSEWSKALMRKLLTKDNGEMHLEQAALGELFLISAVNAPNAGTREAIVLGVRRTNARIHLLGAMDRKRVKDETTGEAALKEVAVDLSAFHGGTPTRPETPLGVTLPHDALDARKIELIARRQSLLHMLRQEALANAWLQAFIEKIFGPLKRFWDPQKTIAENLERVQPEMTDMVLPSLKALARSPQHEDYNEAISFITTLAKSGTTVSAWASAALLEAKKTAN